MLLLSRKCGQSIIINDDTVVTVVSVERNRVRLGIRAPGYVPVYREEVVERMIAGGEIEPLECLKPQPAATA
ncbi:MAG: carbon storage regulator [Pirellulales bacterium]